MEESNGRISRSSFQRDSEVVSILYYATLDVVPKYSIVEGIDSHCLGYKFTFHVIF
jgi:hypothetical protein